MRRIDDWRWRLRRLAVLICTALIVVSVAMFLGVQLSVTHNGAGELIDGRADTSPLALPLACFLVGAVGLMAALGSRPSPK